MSESHRLETTSACPRTEEIEMLPSTGREGLEMLL